jgi:hypothetical protein
MPLTSKMSGFFCLRYHFCYIILPIINTGVTPLSHTVYINVTLNQHEGAQMIFFQKNKTDYSITNTADYNKPKAASNSFASYFINAFCAALLHVAKAIESVFPVQSSFTIMQNFCNLCI